MDNRLCFSIILSLLLTTAYANTTVYRTRAADGSVSFSDQKPSRAQLAHKIFIPERSEAQLRQAAQQRSNAAAAATMQTPQQAYQQALAQLKAAEDALAAAATAKDDPAALMQAQQHVTVALDALRRTQEALRTLPKDKA